MSSWIVCQLGAREHYAVPRALYQAGHLQMLLTDAWVKSDSLVHYLPGKTAQALKGRYHAELSTASVQAFTRSQLPFELAQRLTSKDDWSRIIARNRWFQRHALRQLEQLETPQRHSPEPILFCYSYAALSILRYAKQKGWRTVLGQVDPGLLEEKQVAALQERYQQRYVSSWTPAPDAYWQSWRQECQLADRIMVNSDWSMRSLIQEGIDSTKIEVASLAYSAPAEAKTFQREYPATFTQDRPLRVLFLGQVILRKGIAALVEAIVTLTDEPIEVWLVGSTELDLSAVLGKYPQLRWFGPQPRSQVQQYYQQADVFLFPTHSDGFGLTQLEAQAWQLPIIASRHCGDVVTHEHNGLILPAVTGKCIAESLRRCAARPESLHNWSKCSANMSQYSPSQLAKTLQRISHALL